MRSIFAVVVGIAAVSVATFDVLAGAGPFRHEAQQAPAAQTVTYVTGSTIDGIVAELKKGPKGPFPGQALRVVDAGPYNVGLAIVHRLRREAQSLSHDKVTEIYQVTDGAGTLLTGGVMVEPTPASAALYALAGPGAAGTAIKGGQSRRIAKGDVAIIPPYVPHMFTEIEGSITYLITRIDPERVLNTQ